MAEHYTAQPVLYDGYDREIPPTVPATPEILTDTRVAFPEWIGQRRIWTETIASNLTPTALAGILNEVDRGGDPYDYLLLAEEIEERDLHYRSVMSTRKDEVMELPISVKAASEDERDEMLANAVRMHLLEEDKLQVLLRGLLDALGKGFAAVEIMWEPGVIWKPAEYLPRPAHFFKPDYVDGTTLRLRTSTDAWGTVLPDQKFVIHLPQLKAGLPVRGGLARLGVLAYLIKSYTLRDWMQFSEIFGIPWVMAKYGPNATAEDKNTLFKAVSGLGRNGKIMVPESTSLEVLDGADADNHALYQNLASWIDDQVSELVLGQTASTSGTPGRLGGDDEQASVRKTILHSDGKALAATLSNQLIRFFIDLNYGPQERYPRMMIAPLSPEDLSALGDFLAKLLPLGLKVSAKDILRRSGLAAPEDEADTLGGEMSMPSTGPAMPRTGMARRRQTSADLLDEIAETALEDWQPQIRQAIAPVRALARESKDLTEFRDKLLDLLDDESPERLLTALAQATFEARGVGDARD